MPDDTVSPAATDVNTLLGDLDAGLFERVLSVALSQVAAATIDTGKTGEVNVRFAFKKIEGTKQVTCEHGVKFTKPTEAGKASEEMSRVTVLHVGKAGKLSLAPENQMSFLDQTGGVKSPAA